MIESDHTKINSMHTYIDLKDTTVSAAIDDRKEERSKAVLFKDQSPVHS